MAAITVALALLCAFFAAAWVVVAFHEIGKRLSRREDRRALELPGPDRRRELEATERRDAPEALRDVPADAPETSSPDESVEPSPSSIVLVPSSTPVPDERALGIADGRTPRFRRRGPEHPIVFAHGILGFDSIGVGALRTDYFRGARERIGRLGTPVHVLRLSPLGTIATRARQLARQIESLPYPRVNIVAHSMGGLDARFAIAHLGLGPRVASLTTIGTPHRGTPIADAGLSIVPVFGPGRAALGMSRFSIEAFRDLTTGRMDEFNAAVGDAVSVDYFSVLAVPRRGVRGVHTLLIAPYLYLRAAWGRNDGLVPASSQVWGEIMDEIDTDHWGQVGWSGRFDSARFYESVALDLSSRGH
jgi:triacylglycerol lipase